MVVHPPELRAPVPLALHHTPYCITFAFYRAPESSAGEADTAPRMLLDPAGLEQRLSQGMLHLALTPQRELAVVHKAGGLPLAPGVLMGAVQVAARRAKELDAWLDVRVREDWARKMVEVR